MPTTWPTHDDARQDRVIAGGEERMALGVGPVALQLLDRIDALPRADRWQSQSRGALRDGAEFFTLQSNSLENPF